MIAPDAGTPSMCLGRRVVAKPLAGVTRGVHRLAVPRICRLGNGPEIGEPAQRLRRGLEVVRHAGPGRPRLNRPDSAKGEAYPTPWLAGSFPSIRFSASRRNASMDGRIISYWNRS